MKTVAYPLKIGPSRTPHGVTLSEVLVSIVIMSIGVVLLSTLLPISILRTAQATQLTQAVLLRNNAEAMIESNLGMLSNLQINNFNAGSTLAANAVIDPLGYFLVNTGGISTTFGGQSSSVPSPSIIRSSGGILNTTLFPVTQTLTAAQLAKAPSFADTIATLPDSWTLVREDSVTSYNPTASPPNLTTSQATTDLNVRNGQNPLNGQYRIVLLDSFGKNVLIRPLYQTGATGLGSNSLSWQNVDSAGNPVATAAMPAFAPAKVRIEFQDRRFTWMMTVRKQWTVCGTTATGTIPALGPDGAPGIFNYDDDNDGTKDNATEQRIIGSDDETNWVAEINLAVFFNRSFKPADEAAFAVTFPVVNSAGNTVGFDQQPGVANVNDDNDSTGLVDDAAESGWLGSDDNRTISFPAASAPTLKKGAFMLEPTQLKWYRIINFNTAYNSATPPVLTTYVLLDQDYIIAPGAAAQGVFMKGVVDVYPLGVRTGTQ